MNIRYYLFYLKCGFKGLWKIIDLKTMNRVDLKKSYQEAKIVVDKLNAENLERVRRTKKSLRQWRKQGRV
ncbi:MAG: hypothetical protein LBV16_08230 [Elusimicrobiota bacterium]|jgi:hypothetical protein|nr:hypothetical protein [Elusimicrobiota bacterium]